jgi:hypothetical protein
MTNQAHFEKDTEMPIERLRDEIDEFEKAQELADEGMEGWDKLIEAATQTTLVNLENAKRRFYDAVSEDPGQCYNCGAYAKTYDGHTYVCPNCGDEWDIWLGPLEDY